MEPESKAPSAVQGKILFLPTPSPPLQSPPTPWTTQAPGPPHEESSLQAKEDLSKVHEKLQTQSLRLAKGQKKKDIQNTTSRRKQDPVRFTISGPDSGLSPGFGLVT